MVDIDVPVNDGYQSTTFISAHVPPATRMKNLKPAFPTALAAWVRGQGRPVIMGIDANAPDVEPPDETKVMLIRFPPLDP